MSGRTGNLNRRRAIWMSSHAHHLADEVPRPCCRWRWGEVAVANGHLKQLRDMGLIKRVDSGRWRTTFDAARAIADYHADPLEPGDVGVLAGQVPLGVR